MRGRRSSWSLAPRSFHPITNSCWKPCAPACRISWRNRSIRRSLKEILSRFTEDIDARDRSSLDRLIVVMGAKGGVGATTVAVNIGVQLSTFARKRVALLDFANPLGNVHLLLDLHPKFTVRDAVDNMDRLDSHFFAGLLTRHKTKLEVLGGVTQPEEWQSIHIPSLERVVNVAQNTFDMVLLDMGSQFSSEWSCDSAHGPHDSDRGRGQCARRCGRSSAACWP